MDNRPSYIAAAGIHSESTARDGGILDSLANAPKFWGLALASGATSVANSFISVANLLSGEDSKAGHINLQKWLNEYDSDWAKYYRNNVDSIDTWGFVASSIAPGVGGMKVFNLGQKALTTAASTGMNGRGLSWATGLLVPKSEPILPGLLTRWPQAHRVSSCFKLIL
jgi:hypothetical protein